MLKCRVSACVTGVGESAVRTFAAMLWSVSLALAQALLFVVIDRVSCQVKKPDKLIVMLLIVVSTSGEVLRLSSRRASAEVCGPSLALASPLETVTGKRAGSRCVQALALVYLVFKVKCAAFFKECAPVEPGLTFFVNKKHHHHQSHLLSKRFETDC